MLQPSSAIGGRRIRGTGRTEACVQDAELTHHQLRPNPTEYGERREWKQGFGKLSYIRSKRIGTAGREMGTTARGRSRARGVILARLVKNRVSASYRGPVSARFLRTAD